MGKTSKWIMNFLVGKKEEKNKKKDSSSFSSESKLVVNTNMPITTTTPKVKRRWSFGRSSSVVAGTETPTHKSNLSFDSSVITRQLLTKALLENHNQLVATNKVAAASAYKTRALQYVVAATKIQAAFRSYLARKALCALKGLVKIQALVRGHLVRKRTTSMLRSMNALMAIQIRARVHRIQQSEELSQLVIENQTTQSSEAKNYWKSKRESSRTEDQMIRYGSSSLSVSKREHHFQIMYPNSSSPSTGRINNASPQNYGNAPNELGYQEDAPSYMANTESFRAKVRSQSEPKRRPVTQKNTRTASSDLRGSSPPVSRDYSTKNRNPWLIKLYRSSKSVKDIECDSSSMTTNDDDYRRTLMAYEVKHQAVETH